MVCRRCIDSVRGIITEMELPAGGVSLGSFQIKRPLTETEQKLLTKKLEEQGFELVLDRETALVTLVKSTLIQYIVHLEETDQPEKLSRFVSEKTYYNYSYLSKIFSDKTGKTIETCLIELKIEKVKELLGFRRWTLSEVAWKLKYSSVQYLSNQFKKVTGITVTEFLDGSSDRKSIDEI